MSNVLDKFIPSGNEKIQLFEKYFLQVVSGNKGEVSEEVKSMIQQFLDAKEFRKSKFKEFISQLRKEDKRIYQNYKRYISREGRVKKVHSPDSDLEVGVIRIPKNLHERFKEYAKTKGVTIEAEATALIEKKLNSI